MERKQTNYLLNWRTCCFSLFTVVFNIIPLFKFIRPSLFDDDDNLLHKSPLTPDALKSEIPNFWANSNVFELILHQLRIVCSVSKINSGFSMFDHSHSRSHASYQQLSIFSAIGSHFSKISPTDCWFTDLK